MPIVVVTRQLPGTVLDPMRAVAEVRYWDEVVPIPRPILLEWVAGAHGLYCMLTERIDAELLDAAGPALRVVSTMSVGYDHVDVAACTARHVWVGNTPGVLTDTTADLTVGLILATARRITEAAEAVKAGEWTTWRPNWLTGADLHGSTVGLVGLGRIGLATARRLMGFDCRILYTGPRPKPAEAAQVNAQFVDWPTFLAESDFISIHCPLNEHTRHLFGPDAFARMQPTAILVNTSRGPVVDPAALFTALTTGQIAAAGLDVTEPEPLPVDHPLLSLPNCVILPHIGSASTATRLKMASMAGHNLVAGVLGEALPFCVNGERNL